MTAREVVRMGVKVVRMWGVQLRSMSGTVARYPTTLSLRGWGYGDTVPVAYDSVPLRPLQTRWIGTTSAGIRWSA